MLYDETITETFGYLTKPKSLSHLQAVALSSDLAELNKHTNVYVVHVMQ